MASREYLSVHNEPRTPEELTQHNCLLYTGLATQDRWPYHAGDRPRSRVDLAIAQTILSR